MDDKNKMKHIIDAKRWNAKHDQEDKIVCSEDKLI